MESDTDERENDFRATKKFKKQKPTKQKKQAKPKPKKVEKKDLCLKLTTKKVGVNSSIDGSSATDNVSDSTPFNHEGAQNSDSEEIVETSHCPTCGKLFDITQMPDHVKVCLHENFEACRLVRHEGYVQRSAFKSAGEKLAAGRMSIDWSFCTVCGTDLSSLTCNQRNLHINRCLDSTSDKRNLSRPANKIANRRGRPTSQKKLKTGKKAAEVTSGDYKSSNNAMKEDKGDAFKAVMDTPSQENEIEEGKFNVKKKLINPKKVKMTKATTQNKEFRCSLCLIKVFSSHNGLALHMYHCQKKHKITTACALALHKPHNDDNDFADDEILSQIRRVDSRDSEKTEEKVKLAPKVRKKRHPRKEKNKIDKHEENMLQLALRVSAGDDLERKKSKKQNTFRFPVMIELSPNTKRKQLEGRFQSITNPPGKEAEDDIPCTPALPPSNLTNAKTNRSRRKQTAETGGADNSQPGPSGISTHRDVLQETLTTNINNGSQPSNSSSHNVFCNVVNDELQSPEVSSSSIKPMSLPDNNDAHSLNAISVVSNDQVVVHNIPSRSVKKNSTAQRSNWSLACNEASTSNSDFRVRNLLSQFDKSSHLEDSSHAEGECNAQPILDVPQSSTSDIVDVKENAFDIDHINSTLAIMKELDEAVNDDPLSRLDEDFFDEQISSSQQSKSHMIHKLIDNPEFSDAKIYVGEKREVVNLHRNILYCNCSELLKEINVAAAKEETVWLENYTKREVMPVVCFIYSGKIEPLVNAAKHDLNLFAKTEELLKKYAVLISDNDQILLDAAVGQHQVKAQGWDKRIEYSTISSQHDESFGVPVCDISISKDTGGNDGNDCVLEKSENSFADDLLPRNLTQQDPAGEENQFQNMSDASTSDYDLFACYNKSENDELPVRQLSRDVFDNNNECDPADPVANDFLSDLNDSMFSEENSVSIVSSFHQGDGSFSLSDVATSSPCSRSKNELVPRAKKRKKKDVTDVPVRKSQRVSIGRGRGNHRTCICCSHSDPRHEDSPKKADTSERLSKFPTSKGLRKSLLSKRIRDNIATPNRREIGKAASQSPVEHKANTLRKRTSSQPTLTSTPSPISIPRKRKIQPKSDDNSSKESVVNTKTLKDKKPNSKQKGTSLSQKKQHSPTIYIGERLPRFKQREHIRSRPEVANMGKSTRGLNRKTTSNKNARKKKKSPLPPVVSDSKDHDIDDVKKSTEHPKDETLASAQSTKVVRETSKKLTKAGPVSENTTVKDESAKDIGHSSDDLISSNPTSSVAIKTETYEVTLSSIGTEKKAEGRLHKEYKFKKLCLAASYALPSPLTHPKVDIKQPAVDVMVNNSDEQIEDDLLNDSFVNKLLDVSSKSGRMSHPGEKSLDISSTSTHESHLSAIMSAPMTPVVVESNGSSRKSLLYIGPVPITPMPDFKRMSTPEVLHRASRIGLKKTLSKVKLKAKLEENYLYHHQIEPEESIVDNDEDLEVNDADADSEEAVKLKDVTPQNLYSFIQLPVEEILTLSTDTVDKIHKNGTLLDKLLSQKNETGKIKRGSRQDRARCWEMVTPGSPLYDPKLSAIVSLSEDIQNAITRPLTGCVGKNYFEHKKYQFECLRFLCDEIEHLYKERYLS